MDNWELKQFVEGHSFNILTTEGILLLHRRQNVVTDRVGEEHHCLPFF